LMSESKTILLVGLVLSAVILGGFLCILASELFPSSSLVHSEMIPIQPGSRIGGAMSGFLWDFRGMDLMFQTLVLFTTAICCLALLREETLK
jgi:multisubunit Na+/H+ antiporter MnhB subunit